MEENNNSVKRTKKRAPKGPNQRLRQRTGILIIIILVLGFGAALVRLSFLTLVQGRTLQEDAVEQQLKDTTLPAKRGIIYDTNGKVLAESASVWQVVLAPIYLENDEQRQAVAKGLSEILELDYDNVYKKTQQQSYYVVVKRKIEVETRDKIIEFIDELDKDYKCGNVIELLDDYKRYYPHDSLAASVIGFAGSDEQGLEGVEYEYDSYLSGTPGRIVTAKNAVGTNMPFQYEQNIEAEDGKNIYLTIDENIQSICEKYMQQGVADNNVLNKGVCIAMDVNTGAILAMVTTDGYNLNDPYELPEDQQKKIDALPEDEQSKAQGEALSAMWRNKAVSDTYMPGSVFKMCVASMAIEEDKVSDDSTFTCTGAIKVGDKLLHCSNTSGHGTQNFLEALCNSCNPAFVQIGQLIGMNKFREYYEGFGFSEKTGIDLPGEAEDTFWADGTMGEVDLAVASFGQNFAITPIQMITACAAVANGGYVLQPYVVSKITDSDGNVVKNMEKKVKRQVISKETSDKMNEMLGYNTQTAGATSGYVTGYKVAGKTGTSEKIGSKSESSFGEDYIASFCGYAPADDPQIAMLVFFDTPSGKAYYGSQVSSPVFINIMSEVLPYLQIKTDYTEEELEYVDVSAGDYTGISVSEAQTAVENDGFTYTVKGSGETVISQIPPVSSKISKGGNIVLYTDSTSQQETVTVPNLIGYSASEVNSVASTYGLNVSFSGAASSNGISSSQDIAEGTSISPGTVITVSFASSDTTVRD
ncbi:MAG: penicillin-binding transpeptidase domain-containing protein [Clostridia bacterium]|nr:penicillin-binding transpeptidase domain-containing protein [Clostridia bacterium]